MQNLIEKPYSVTASWGQLKGLLATFGPAKWRERRELALRDFEGRGIPSTKDEEFKYVSFKVLEVGNFQPAYGAIVDREDLSKTSVGKIEGITVAFINGQYAPELSAAHVLPAGVFVGSLADGEGIYPELVEEWLGRIATTEAKLGTTNDDRFIWLNEAFLSEGALVVVPRGTLLEKPIHLLFLSKADHGPCAVHPRTLVILEEGAQAKIVESYIGLEGTSFTNAVTEVLVGEQATLEHTKIQQETATSIHVATTGVHQGASSVYTSNNIGFGSQISRNDVNVWIDGEHAETWLNGAAVGLDDQVVDNHTRIDHAKPNCNSFEVYKTILGGRANGVFNGKIFVYKDAQKTDAKQTNQAILLSARAAINSKPQLEIFADDVKCTHGATVGRLSEEALFYMQARGIPVKQARALLVYAFAAEVLEKITVAEARAAMERVLYDRLNQVEDLPESA